jgi:hypothetical protein
MRRASVTRGGFRRRRFLHPQAKGHVLKHGHVREQGIALKDGIDVAVFRGNMGDILVFKMDMAAIDVFQPGDKAQYGCFTAARGAKQREKLTVVDGQIEIGNHVLPSKLLRIRSSCTSGERERGCVFNFCSVPCRRLGSRPKRGLCVTTLVTRNEGGHSTANPVIANPCH